MTSRTWLAARVGAACAAIGTSPLWFPPTLQAVGRLIGAL